MLMKYLLQLNPFDAMHLYFAKLSKYFIMTVLMESFGGT